MLAILMKKNIKIIKINLPRSLHDKLEQDAHRRYRTVEEHARDVLRASVVKSNTQ